MTRDKPIQLTPTARPAPAAGIASRLMNGEHATPAADEPAVERPAPSQQQPNQPPWAVQLGGPTHERPVPPPRHALSRPMRWLVAGAEVAAAAALAVFAVWAWRRVLIPVQLPDYQNQAIPDFASRMSGPWAAAAVGAVTVAGLLALDAIRQAVLASRVGPHDEAPQHETTDDEAWYGRAAEEE